MKLHGIVATFIVLVSATSLVFAGPGQGKGKGKGGPGGKGKPTPEKVMNRLDKDGNGSISKSEAPERMASHFDRMDANSDGAISLDELKAAFKKRAEKGGKGPGGKGKGGKGKGGKGKPTPENFIKKFDKDGNGTISKSELPEKMQQRFDKIDQNGDGAIDTAELKKMMARHAERGGKGPGGKKPAK